MYQTATVLRRELRVRYPKGEGRMVLRSELDWDADLEPTTVSDDGETSVFMLESKQPFLYFKPCLRDAGEFRRAVVPAMLVLMTSEGASDVYPYFDGSESGTFSALLDRPSEILGREHRVRVYLPPGYHQNPLRRYPIVYMQDGK